jgi:hypothetical protein
VELLSYPREWFRAGRWDDEPVARTFIRETEFMLVWKNGKREAREMKVCGSVRWYQTLEEAQAAIDIFKADKAKADHLYRLRQIALEMEQALRQSTAALRDAMPQVDGRTSRAIAVQLHANKALLEVIDG